MVIRPALIADLDNFYDCFRELMQEGYAGYSQELKDRFLLKDYSINNFYLWLERVLRFILIAEENSYVQGFLVGDYTYGGVAFVSWLGVRPQFRGQDIGKNLYLRYEEFAKQRHAHLIELYTYDKIVPFYERLGFIKIGVRDQGYFGQKNIIMDKKLGVWDGSALIN